MTKIAGFGYRSRSGSTIQRHGSPDPDPHQNVMDPQHWFAQSWLNLRNKHRDNPIIEVFVQDIKYAWGSLICNEKKIISPLLVYVSTGVGLGECDECIANKPYV
jgi:hypothetical protein